MKQSLAKRIIALGLLITCHALQALEVDVVEIDNPYIEIRSIEGDSVWISRNDVDHLPQLARSLATADNQVIASGFSSRTNSLIADLVTVSKAFRLGNRALSFTPLPFFDTKLKAHFFESPVAGDYNRIYQLVNNYCAQAPNTQMLLELLDASARFFPLSVLQVVIWSALQKQKSPDLLTMQLPESLKSHKLLLLYLRRCAYPPEGSIFTKMVLDHSVPLEVLEDFEENVTTVDLQSKKIDSLFGLGSLCDKMAFAAGWQNSNPPMLRIDLSDNQITSIDEIDVFESHGCEMMLNGLELQDNKISSIAPSFLKRAERLQLLDLSNNQLTRLPEIKNSTHLLIMRVDSNNLEELPANFLDQAKKLVEFSASYNHLKRLPEPFLPNATNLGVLDLSYNLELELSDTFLSGNYPQLKYVKIAGLNARKLPNRMLQNALQVEDIDVSRNKLTFLPAGILNQKELEELKLDGNPLMYDEAAFQQLPESIQEAIRNAYKVPDENADDSMVED